MDSTQRLWFFLWRRAVLGALLLRVVPYVRMVGLNGSMVTGSFHAGSDIDFYVVLKPGHIYTGRVLTTVLLDVLQLRRRGNKVAGRICLNRFATTHSLEITPHDTYHARTFHALLPLFACGRTYRHYCARNSWMARLQLPVKRQPVLLSDTMLSWCLRSVLELVLWPISGLLEQTCRSWQQGRVARDERAQLPGSVVVLSERELRFHLVKES